MARILGVLGTRRTVGATALCVHLAQAFSLGGIRSLIVDLDPVGGATRALGASRSRSGLLRTILAGRSADPESAMGMLLRSVDAGLDLIPAEATLQEDPLEEVDSLGLERALRPLQAQYPIILLEASSAVPWSQGLLERVCDHLLLPVSFGPFGLDGLEALLRARQELKRPPRTDHVVMTATEERVRRDGPPRKQSGFPESVQFCRTAIPWDEAIATAMTEGHTVFQEAPEGRGARAYAQLAKEILQHVG
ncbi:MAG: ParA family protein [Planctomycetes bacterium]|nr:ParA family protein [Planctomycetota bacterium]